MAVPAAPEYREELGEGLVRRWSTAADWEKIGHCLATVYRGSPDEPLPPYMPTWVAILFSPGFPLMGPEDFAVVEDTSRPEAPIVACACLWRQCWSLGGIRFGVGRTEYVATLPEYRNRGLIRGLMEMIHARSEARGDLVQAITGIPFYYRQFGYEYVLDLGGSRRVFLSAVPSKKEGEAERYRLRPAVVEDAPYLLALYNRCGADSLVWSEMTEERWRCYMTVWELPEAHGPDRARSGLQLRVYMVVDAAGQACGYVAVGPRRWKGMLHVSDVEMDAHVNWLEAMPSLLRALAELAQQTPPRPIQGQEDPPPSEITFALGRAHPFYDVLGDKLAPYRRPPYAWYVRVPDPPGFVQRIAPVLEERLARSPLVGYSGELKIDFYRGGLRLQFDGGKLTAAEPWRAPAYGDEAKAGFPPLVFLKLLFGYRSLAELRAGFPDAWAEDEAVLLLETLFPKQPSWVQETCYT